MHVLSAQIVTGEQPIGLTLVQSSVSRNANIVSSDTMVQILSAPDRAILNMEDSIAGTKPGPLRFARAVQVSYTLYNSGTWQVLANGDRLWRLKVKLPGALSTNATYDRFWLPEGAKFFVYSEETKQSIGAVTSEYIGGSYEEPVSFATALIYGESVVFEYYQPVSVKDSAVISISNIYYGYRYVNNPYAAQIQDYGGSGSCEININCPEGNSWQTEKRAVARISIPVGQDLYWCSCALINNTNNNNTPYVLTADHCLHGLDANGSSNASQWIFYWDYEYSGCNNGNTEPAHKTTVGATVKANNSVSDFALLQLTQHPSNLTNFVPYYLGWDRSGNAVTSGVGIHHPNGDVKKISQSNQIVNESNQVTWKDENNNIIAVSQPNTLWKVMWQTGITEEGSSGSPLINNVRMVIGQFSGGNSECTALTDPDHYGKFNVSWTGNGTTYNYRKLQPWLDPAGTNPTTLEGKSHITILGPDIIAQTCQGNYTVSLTPGATFQSWSTSSSALTITQNNGINGCTVSRTSNTTSPITAALICNYLLDGVSRSVQKSITLRISADNFNVYELNCLCEVLQGNVGKQYYFTSDALPVNLITGYYWTVTPPGFSGEEGENSFVSEHSGRSTQNDPEYFTTPGYYTINLQLTDGCGLSGNASTLFYVSPYSNMYFVYPNPSSGQFSLKENKDITEMQFSTLQTTVKSRTNSNFVLIQLRTLSGTLLKQVTVDLQNETSINASDLPDGLYVLSILKDGRILESENIVIKK